MEHGTEGLVRLVQPPPTANLGASVSILVHSWLNFGVRDLPSAGEDTSSITSHQKVVTLAAPQGRLG